MLNTLLQSVWFFLPAGIANMAPVLFKRVSFLGFPISTKYLGAHKTYRGFFFGIICAILTVYVQKFINLPGTLIDYQAVNIYLFGALIGFGALFGDSVESYFKRKGGIKPGGDWPVFDQIDWILGGLLFSFFYIKFTPEIFVDIFIVFAFLHAGFNWLKAFLKL